MNNFKISDKDLVEGFARKLGFYVSNMNISEDAKELFLEILSKLPEEKTIEIAEILEYEFAYEQQELLRIELENKLEKLAIYYAQKQRKIDDQTIKELNKIFKK